MLASSIDVDSDRLDRFLAEEANHDRKQTKGFCSPLVIRYGLIAYVLSMMICWWFIMPLFTMEGNGSCASTAPLVDVFPGKPWRTSQTIASTLLLSTPRARVESHTVRGEDGSIYSDWLWMDVTDQINVMPFVIRAPPADHSRSWNKYRDGGQFIVFRQRKYGMIGESLAVMGGQLDIVDGVTENPLTAAHRELREELFLVARNEVTDWIDLGSFRVNVNRGHGTVSCFLLLDAQPLPSSSDASAEFKVDELERQTIVRLSVPQMMQAVRDHQFGEVKWQATAAMALLEVMRRADEEDQRLAVTSAMSG